MDNEKTAKAEQDIENFKTVVQATAAVVQEAVRPWKVTVLALVSALTLVVVGFIWYLYQFDYVSTTTTTTDATGIYTNVDGGIITSQDIDPETWKLFMEWLDGKNKSDQDKDKDAGSKEAGDKGNDDP